MTNLIKQLIGTTIQPAITLGPGLGAGRISAQIDNSTIRAPRGKVGLKLFTGGTAPTANTVYKLYLVKQIGTIQGGTIGAAPGTADAPLAVEPLNSECVGSLQVRNTANDLLADVFDVENPGPFFSFAVWNATNQNAATSGGLLEWTPITDEVQ